MDKDIKNVVNFGQTKLIDPIGSYKSRLMVVILDIYL